MAQRFLAVRRRRGIFAQDDGFSARRSRIIAKPRFPGRVRELTEGFVSLPPPLACVADFPLPVLHGESCHERRGRAHEWMKGGWLTVRSLSGFFQSRGRVRGGRTCRRRKQPPLAFVAAPHPGPLPVREERRGEGATHAKEPPRRAALSMDVVSAEPGIRTGSGRPS